MGRTRQVIAVSGKVSVKIEYVRYRDVIRVRATPTGGNWDGAVEVPATALLKELGVGAEAPKTRYLVFAGRHEEPRGGSRDLVAVYDSEAEARRAFTALRRQRHGEGGWGELVSFNGRGHFGALGWFGY